MPEPAGVPIAVAAGLPVRVMVVFDYARWKDQDAALGNQIYLPEVGISVAMRGCWGPFEDSEGQASHWQESRRSSASGSTCLLLAPRCSGKLPGSSHSSWSGSARAGAW